jgi:hypothetical protein
VRWERRTSSILILKERLTADRRNLVCAWLTAYGSR